MERSYDFIVVGAGVLGLTTALELAKRHAKARILILEKEAEAGRHASGRNSGVLHSGIYYPPGSLKAKVCVEGRRRMREFVEFHDLPLRPAGKVIIPTEAKELKALDKLMANAQANGVQAELLDAQAIQKKEPHAAPFQKGIYLPEVAVVDPKAVLRKLVALCGEAGIEIAWNQPVGRVLGAGRIETAQGNRVAFGFLVNCAGAYADRLARAFGLAKRYALVPFKGIYYRLAPAKRDWVRSNIYPVPDPQFPFLGVHFTKGVDGEVEVGPTAIPALSREHYGLLAGLRFGEACGVLGHLGGMFFSGNAKFRNLVSSEVGNYVKSIFVKRVQKLVPGIEAQDLTLSGKVGIRAQLMDLEKKELVMDYVVEKGERSMHVLNAISPAFTSSFAFAEGLVNQV